MIHLLYHLYHEVGEYLLTNVPFAEYFRMHLHVYGSKDIKLSNVVMTRFYWCRRHVCTCLEHAVYVIVRL